MLIHKTVAGFLDETASSSPAPGGGSVSALAASLSAALTSMVCRLTVGKKKYAAHEGDMKGALQRSEELRDVFRTLIDADTAAFQTVMAAFAMPRESEAEKLSRDQAIESATKQATHVPLEVLRHCARMAPLIHAVAERGNVNSRTDAGVAALLLGTAAQGAAMNVLINLGGLKDAEFVLDVRRETEELERSIVDSCASVVADIRGSL